MHVRSRYLSQMCNYKTGDKAANVGQLHEVTIVYPEVSKDAYYSKPEFKNQFLAQTEANAQEILRALYSATPETRLALDDQDRTYVLSKSISGFKSLYEIIKSEGMTTVLDKINKGIYKGLGNIMVMAVLTNEADLHMNNIGINDKGEFIKIDGDWTFARLRHGVKSGNRYQITDSVIQKLPLLDMRNFMPYNWFDQLVKRDIRKGPAFLDGINNEIIRQEINESLLKCILMPKEYLKSIIAHQSLKTSNTDTIYMELMHSRKEMILAACQNNDFQKFMTTASAKNTLDQFKSELNSYKLVNSSIALDSEVNISARLSSKFEQIQKLSDPAISLAVKMRLYTTLPEFEPTLTYNKMGENPFLLAIKTNNIDQAKAVYDNLSPEQSKQVLNKADNRGITPIMAATRNRHDHIYRYLKFKKSDMDKKDNHGNNVFLIAAKYNNLEVIRQFTTKSANAFDVNIANNNGNSALILAAKYGNQEIVEFLLESGVKTNIVNNSNVSAILHAATNKHEDIVINLLDYPNSNEQLNYALSACLRHDQTETAVRIFEKCSHADTPTQDNDKVTPLMIAITNDDNKTATLLLTKMTLAGINYQSATGDTALMYAVRHGNYTMVNRLLKRISDLGGSAQLNLKNQSEQTALQLAMMNGYTDILNILRENNASQREKQVTNPADTSNNTTSSINIQKNKSSKTENNKHAKPAIERKSLNASELESQVSAESSTQLKIKKISSLSIFRSSSKESISESQTSDPIKKRQSRKSIDFTSENSEYNISSSIKKK